MTALVAYMDHFDVAWDDELDPDEDTRQALTSQHSHQHALHNGPSIELTASSGTAASAAPPPAGEQSSAGQQAPTARRQQVCLG